VLMSAELKDAGRLRQTLRMVVDALACTQEEGAHIKRCLDEAPIPSKATLSRFRFWVDIAHMIRRGDRRRGACRQQVYFLMCDSSPQHGYRLLLTRLTSMPTDGLAGAAEDMDALRALHRCPRWEWSEEDRQQGLACAHRLAQRFHTHVCVPASYGAGKKSGDLASKLAVLSHQLWLEVASLQDFRDLTASVVAFTGDLGTESGLADAPAIDLQDLLPSLCGGVLEVEDESSMRPNSVESPSAHSFPRALFYAGTQHILGNIVKDMVEVLPSFERWYTAVLPLSQVLRRKDTGELIQATFFAKDPLRKTYGWLFDTACPNLAEWRWRTLINVLEHLLPRILPLRLVWDAQRIQGLSR